jgi:hypothetical protein
MSFDERGGSDARLDSVAAIAADDHDEIYRKDDDGDAEADALLTPVPLSIWAADSCSVVKVRLLLECAFDCPRDTPHALNVPSYSYSTHCHLQAFIGSNYLGVPYSFHLCGIALAVPLFWAIAFFSRQGCRLLIDCKVELDRRDKDQSDNAIYGGSIGSNHSGGGSAYALAGDGVGSGSVDESAGRLRRTSHGHAVNHTTTSSSSPSQPLLSASSSSLSSSSSSSLHPSSPRASATAIEHAASAESDHAGGGYAIVGERLFGANMAHLVRACLVLTQVPPCSMFETNPWCHV